MQQPGSMFPVMPSFPPTNITTEQIQKYLDENKKLILAILDNQNLGKLAECAQYQAQLQKNLMYLAAIADAQPQTPAMPTQMSPHPAMQQGGFYMQHPQAAAMAQQQAMFQQRPHFSSPHPLQADPQHHLNSQQAHQQASQGRSVGGGPNNDMNPQHHGGPSSSTPTSNSNQDKPDGRAGGDGQRNSSGVRGGGEAKEAK